MDPATVGEIVKALRDPINFLILAILAIAALGFRWAWTALGRHTSIEPVDLPEPTRIPHPPTTVAGHSSLCVSCTYRTHPGERWTQEDLRRHRFWRYMDHSIGIVIPALTLKEYGRQLLAIDFLQLKFQCTLTQLQTFVKEADLETMSPMELEDGLLAAIEKAVDDYEAEALRLGVRKAGTVAMEVFLHKFGVIHAPVVTQVREYVIVTCQSTWLGDDSITKVAQVLDYMVNIFQRTLADVERTMGRLNGKLSGLSYNGVTIGPCPDSMSGETTCPGGLHDCPNSPSR